MQIILLDKISNLGNLGDQINVRDGYARNFLIPYGKAVLATKENIEFFQKKRTELESRLAEVITIANDRAKKVNELGIITIKSKAGETGKLFGSIGSRDIAAAVTAAGVKVTKNEIRLPNGVLRTIGEHEVILHFHSKILAKLRINILPK